MQIIRDADAEDGRGLRYGPRPGQQKRVAQGDYLPRSLSIHYLHDDRPQRLLIDIKLTWRTNEVLQLSYHQLQYVISRVVRHADQWQAPRPELCPDLQGGNLDIDPLPQQAARGMQTETSPVSTLESADGHDLPSGFAHAALMIRL
jgi:hypothetical protein